MSNRDKFVVLVCSPRDVVTEVGGATTEEAEATARKMQSEGWVLIEIKENPASAEK